MPDDKTRGGCADLRRAVEAAARKAALKEEEENAAKARAALIEILSASYDKAAAYANVIILAGFAGGFAIWSNVQENISTRARITVALLLTISLATFVFFEI